MKAYVYICLCLGSFAIAQAGQSSSRESLFSITPEQMVFASKLSEPYRKMYCHKFSMKERQEALEEWMAAQDTEQEVAILSPDDAVQEIFHEYYPSPNDPFIELGDTR